MSGVYKVFEIIFGSIFAFFSGFMFYAFNFLPGEGTGSLAAANVIMTVFFTIGIMFIVKGVKKLIINKKTDLHGELCYGQVKAVKFNGTVINGVQQYDAYLRVYIESTGKFVEAHENIGDKVHQFPEAGFYAVKYYEGDINFEYPVPSFDALPAHIKEVFDDGQIIPNDNSWYSNSEDNNGVFDSFGTSNESSYNPNMYNYDYELEAEARSKEAEFRALGEDEFANDAYKAMLR